MFWGPNHWRIPCGLITAHHLGLPEDDRAFSTGQKREDRLRGALWGLKENEKQVVMNVLLDMISIHSAVYSFRVCWFPATCQN